MLSFNSSAEVQEELEDLEVSEVLQPPLKTMGETQKRNIKMNSNKCKKWDL